MFIQKLLNEKIKGLGHNVVQIFDSYESTIPQIFNLNFDLVFLDIILPRKSGIEVLKKILEEKPHTNVIVLSGLAEDELIKLALDYGAVDYLKKPIEDEALLTVLTKIRDSYYIPTAMNLSKIELCTNVVSLFLKELLAITSINVRKVIKSQIFSILNSYPSKLSPYFELSIDTFDLTAKEEIWGNYSEREVLDALKTIPFDLREELRYVYPEDFIKAIFESAVMLLTSRNQTKRFFMQIQPEELGLPTPPSINFNKLLTNLQRIEQNYSSSIAIASSYFGELGPSIQYFVGEKGFIAEEDLLKSAIFYFSLLNQAKSFERNIFGPLPVSNRTDLSSIFMILSDKTEGYLDINKTTIIIIFYKMKAENIIDNYQGLNFILRKRLVNVHEPLDLSKAILRGIKDDLIEYLQDK